MLLLELWTYVAQAHRVNRTDSCATVLASIYTDLRAADRYPDEDLIWHRLLVEAIRARQGDPETKRQVHCRNYFAPPRQGT